jgi:Uma2 family endonuclease
MKTHIQAAYGDFFYYPDLQVCCQKDDAQRYYKQSPKLIIEVLSNATQRHDRCEKFNNYRQLDSLEEYVLVAQDKRQLEIYRRAGQWQAVLATGNDAIGLESIGLALNLADVYEGVAFLSRP